MNAAARTLAESTSRKHDAVRQRRFELLVHAHRNDLYRRALWLSHCPDTAQDLTQETFLRAWRSFDDLRETKAIKSWLYTILQRENARRFERIQPDFSDQAPDNVAAPVTHDTRTEALVLRNALEQLPADYREPLLLQVVGGYSYREIGERLSLSQAAVTTRLFRARQKLHHMLTGA